MTDKINIDELEFDFAEHYDEELASAGREFEVFAPNGNKEGTFICAYWSSDNPEVALAIDRTNRKYFHALQAEKKARKKDAEYVDHDLQLKMLRDVFLDGVLLGWKDITAKGKPVPFSKEAARKYFESKKATFVLAELTKCAVDEMNFQGEAKEAVSGN